jgi:hypothetical protein
MTTAIAPRQGRGYGCRKDENPICPARVRIVAEPLEAFVEGYVIDQWRNPEAIKIAQSDDDRMARIREITDDMRRLQEQKNEALRMKLRKEVDAKTFRDVTTEIDAALDQLAREHKRLASEAAMPALPDPSLGWEDLSAEQACADRDAGRQDRCRSTSSQDRQGRQTPLHHPRHPIPRSSARGGAAQGGAQGSGQDRPQGLSAQSNRFPRRIHRIGSARELLDMATGSRSRIFPWMALGARDANEARPNPKWDGGCNGREAG